MAHHLNFILAPADACRSVTGHHLDRGESPFQSFQGLPKSHEPRSAERAQPASVSVWAGCDLFEFADEAQEGASSKAQGPEAMHGSRSSFTFTPIDKGMHCVVPPKGRRKHFPTNKLFWNHGTSGGGVW